MAFLLMYIRRRPSCAWKSVKYIFAFQVNEILGVDPITDITDLTTGDFNSNRAEVIARFEALENRINAIANAAKVAS